MHITQRVEVVFGDITQLNVECIVNAANKTLLGGGGVDGAIHREAGSQLREYCSKLGGCNTGEAKITPGFNLKAKFIIHTVGPIYSKRKDKLSKDLLANCYFNTLKLAYDHSINTIAFPAISTGAYKFPFKEASLVALESVFSFLSSHSLPRLIYLVAYSREDYTQLKELTSSYINNYLQKKHT